jgi:deoxycytidine triphosphate deaminase
MPTKAHQSDAGADLTATSKHWDEEKQCWIYGTGIAAEIPEGYVGLVFPRSSIRKYGLALANSIGVIDSGYRGEIMCSFKPTGSCPTYNVGDKVNLPATITGITVDETGSYFDLKIKANNKIVNLHCEEEDIVKPESTPSQTDITPSETDTETDTTTEP